VRALRPVALLALAGTVGTLVGCTSEPAADTADASGDRVIVVASFDFPESELLAEIYGQALAGEGFEVRIEPRLGPRELVQPALAAGLVDFVPEYAGTALEFVSLGDGSPAADADATHAALRQALDDRIVALAAAPAQNANAVVVRGEVADRHDLRDISDLAAVADRLTIGGPPECPVRPFCLAGLERTYGLTFGDFLPLDAGGPLTHQALDGGHVDAAVLFTTDPDLDEDGLVLLRDNRHLQPAENVTPLVRAEVVERRGEVLVPVVDGVSARLTTDVLRDLNGRVAGGEPIAEVADRWLHDEGLV
jgi:osmoprotectant transport system substrate-binding protein